MTTPRGPLAGSVAVVTGASHGIGRSVALRLALEGADVALLDIDGTALDPVAGEVGEASARALPLALDCTDRDQVEAAFAQIRDQLGPVGILVNNVGQGPREKMQSFSKSDLTNLDFLLTINLKTCVYATHAAIGDMKAAKYGKIVNISSEAAVNGAAMAWDYAAAKSGIIGFSRAISRELAPFGITVNIVGPGMTRTRAFDSMDKTMFDRMVARIPAGRMGEPEEIANAVYFFSSSQSDFITGQTLLVNGGGWYL